MSFRVVALSIVISAFVGLTASSDAVKTKALGWLANAAAQATEEMKSAEADLAKAQSAAQLAEQAAAISRQQNDTTMESKANAAIASARSEATRARDRIEKARARIAKLKSVMTDAAPGATGFALEMKGSATLTSNGQSKVWNGSPAALGPGDVISVGKGGRLVLVFDDGHEVTVSENSEFEFVAKPNTNPKANLLERAMGFLRKGVARINRPVKAKLDHPAIMGVLGQVDYRTPTAVAAVRGTDFVLRAEGNAPSRFIPFSGEVEIGADAKALQNYKQVAWWPAFASTGSSIAKGTTAIAATGVVSVERADKKLTLLKGTAISDGDTLLVADKSGVVLNTAEGLRIALAGGTRLDLARDGESKGAVYILRRGRMHVWTNGKPTSARFLTLNSIAQGSAKEFEVSIGAGGVGEYLPIDGSIIVTAVESRLDWSKISEWKAN